MTAVAAPREVLIPAPLAHQEPIVESSARFKVVRAGRRGGKTVLAEGCAIVGHGPMARDGEPVFRGIAHDLDVVWVARDYTQAGIMWHEFIRPRFKGVGGVRVNEAERTVSLEHGGTLFVISAENIASARGMGKRLAGVIIEEAAWLDLQSALRDVILPALMDNEGWIMLISTTNAGSDGGRDESGQPRTPSYFNVICEEIRKGERSREWAEFHFTAQDNPKISEHAFQTLVDEYAADSPSLKQEVYAELLAGGVGLALDQVCAERHLVAPFKIPEHWTRFGAFDWGYEHPYAFGDFTVSGDGQLYLVDTVWGRKEQPEQISAKVGKVVPIDRMAYVVGGLDLWHEKKARGETGPTLAEHFANARWPLIQATVSRVTGLNNLRRYVAWKVFDTDGTQTGEQKPRFLMFDTPGNRRVLACLESMRIDEKNIEDALKVDADYAGRGGDDAYDMTRYALMTRPLLPAAPGIRRSEDIDRTHLQGTKVAKDPVWDRFDREHRDRRFRKPVRSAVRVVPT
jgi:hypothetical protein